jgi:glycosyltransferase involved in cell wall biosynthesis
MMWRLSFFMDILFVATKHDMQRKKAFYGLDYVAVLSDEMKKTVRAKHVEKIYNGIVPTIPEPVKLPGRFNVVAVGGLRPVKRFDRLIEAIAKLPDEVHLTIVGEGSERENLERLSEKLGIKTRVHLVGFKQNVPDYLAACDMQVISSDSEGFSLAMVEGLFYAPVVISTKVSGATEILSEKLLCEGESLAQKIRDVYNETEAYKKETARIAARYRDKLTMEGCAKEYIRFYGKILEDFNA